MDYAKQKNGSEQNKMDLTAELLLSTAKEMGINASDIEITLSAGSVKVAAPKLFIARRAYRQATTSKNIRVFASDGGRLREHSSHREPRKQEQWK